MPIMTALQRRLDAAIEHAATAQLHARGQLATRLDSINNFLSGLGSAGDKGASARPDVMRLPLSAGELITLYRYNGYARRFVDLMPHECTRAGWRVLDGTDDGAPTLDDDERLRVKESFAEAYIWARLFGGALILPVLDEDIPAAYQDRPAEWLRQPLDLSRIKRVVNLVVLDTQEFAAGQYDSNLRSSNFRRPKFWHIAPRTEAYLGEQMTQGGYVHHSRVIYIPGARVPNALRQSMGGVDDSILQAPWDQLRHKTSSDQGIAALMQELKLNMIKVKGLAAMSMGDQAEYHHLRMRQIAEGKSINNLVVLDEGEDLQQMSAQVAGVGDLDDRSRTALAAVTGIPQVILYGDTPGGLNTDGDSHRRIWDKVINACQEAHLLPGLMRYYEMLFASTDGPEEPEQWSVEFHSGDEPTDKEQAEVEKLHAETDAIRIEYGILPADHIANSRYGAGGYQASIMPLETPGEKPGETTTKTFEDAALLAGELEGGPIAAAQGVEKAQDTSLNGAQLKGILEIVEAVNQKRISRASAIAMVELGFPVSKQQAEQLIDSPPEDLAPPRAEGSFGAGG